MEFRTCTPVSSKSRLSGEIILAMSDSKAIKTATLERLKLPRLNQLNLNNCKIVLTASSRMTKMLDRKSGKTASTTPFTASGPTSPKKICGELATKLRKDVK